MTASCLAHTLRRALLSPSAGPTGSQGSPGSTGPTGPQGPTGGCFKSQNPCLEYDDNVCRVFELHTVPHAQHIAIHCLFQCSGSIMIADCPTITLCSGRAGPAITSPAHFIEHRHSQWHCQRMQVPLGPRDQLELLALQGHRVLRAQQVGRLWPCICTT